MISERENSEIVNKMSTRAVKGLELNSSKTEKNDIVKWAKYSKVQCPFRREGPDTRSIISNLRATVHGRCITETQ